MLRELYRSDYDGEFVVVSTSWKDGKKSQHREWVPNPISNKHLSGRAVVIGEGSSRGNFKLFYLEKHRGGLLGRNKLQTYGVDSIASIISLDFHVVLDEPRLVEFLEQGVPEHTALYTTTSNCIAHPGQCFMVPYNVKTSPLAVATYLAAFDEHKEVFVIGADAPDGDVARAKHVAHMCEIFTTYPAVRFRIVTDIEQSVPSEWRQQRNVAIWPYRKFISECDIG